MPRQAPCVLPLTDSSAAWVSLALRGLAVKLFSRMQSQLDYARRHQRTVLYHLTPRKIANILQNELEMRALAVTLKSRPFFIKIEPTLRCHLRCTGCPFHGPSTEGLTTRLHMTLAEFKRLVDPLADVLLGISLSLRGDSLHAPELLDMVRYCHERNIGTAFPTNFSYKLSDEKIEELVECGLDHLMISLDGTTQEAYEQYRRGGNLDLILDNCRRLIAAKKRRGAVRPFLEWKFVRFAHNRHQLEDARRMAGEMGFDRFSWMEDHQETYQRTVAQSNAGAARLKRGTPCFWLYRTMVICWDGRVLPCCNDHFDMGTAGEQGVLDIWNGPQFQELRRMFRTGIVTGANGLICENCPEYWGSVFYRQSN